jgi:hypothetical protein
MKLTTSTTKIERSAGLSRDNSFSIAASAKAFEILSSGLYKDSVRAVVRELGTNAADAHVAAGKRNVPFVAHLPTNLEPFFSVRDWGIGLSDRQIRGGWKCAACDHEEPADFEVQDNQCLACGQQKMQFEHGLYTTYFASDKSHSDDYTGCLGLGSKSPFSISESFTVTSVKDGKKGIYTCFKNEGNPGVQLLSLEDTTEPNGVEVKLPVPANQFVEFRTKAIETYRWFNPRPMVPGLTGDMFDTGSRAAFETGDFTIWGEKENLAVLMGNVRYEINFWDLDESFKKELDPYETFIAREVGPMLRVGIGEVDIAASRETLKFSNKTHATLKRRLQQVVQECQAEAEKRIQKANTLWEARIVLKEMSSSHWLSNLLGNGVKWRGKLVTTRIMVGEGRVRCHVYTLQHGRRSRIVLSSDEAVYIPADRNVEIFRRDVATAWQPRIHRYLQENYPNLEYRESRSLYLLSDGEDETVDKFIEVEELGPVVKLVSSLPEPERIKVVRPKTAKLLKLRYGSQSPVYSWTDAVMDLDEGEENIYVEVNGYNWSAGVFSEKTGSDYGDKANWRAPSRLRNVLSDIVRYSDVDQDAIIGVRSAMLDRVQKLKNWVRLDQYLISKCQKDEKGRLAAAKKTLWHKITGTIPNIIVDLNVDNLRPKNPVRQLHDIFNDLMSCDSSDSAACRQTCDLVNVELPDLSKLEAKIDSLANECAKRYPLWSILPNLHSLDRKKQGPAFVDYISMMDRRPRAGAATAS